MAQNEQNDCDKQIEDNNIDQDNETKAKYEKYWQTKYEQLQNDYEHLQKINQNLEDKLLNVVETFEKKKEELYASVELEKSTLMADVNKLSTKLVDARIKLHDYEEKDMLHAAECDSPCHRSGCNQTKSSNNHYSKTNNVQLAPPSNGTNNNINDQMINDPNLV